MAIPTITPLSEAPSRQETEETFVPKADALLGQLPEMVTEMNTGFQWIEDQSIVVEANRDITLDASTAAQGAANYKGDWTVSTNVLQGESYSYAGSTWVAKQNSVGQTPAVGVYWLKGVGTAATLDVTTSTTDTTAGRVLKVGDGGVLDVVITGDTSVGLNAKFRVSSTTTGDKPAGMSEGVMDVNSMGGDFSQTFHSYTNPNVIASRWYKGGVFTDFIYHWHTGNLAEATANQIHNGDAGSLFITPSLLSAASSLREYVKYTVGVDRSSGVIYTNTDAMDRLVSVSTGAGPAPNAAEVRKSPSDPWVIVGFQQTSISISFSFEVPAGQQYRVNASIVDWSELS